ncbi:MAG: S4 domain-containing protein, partial [Euzebya sp.]
GLAEAIKATDVLFGDEPFSGLSETVLADAFDGAPSTDLAPGYQNGQNTVGQLLMAVGAAKSGGEARRLISQGGVRVNNVRVEDPSRAVTRADFASDRTVVVRVGKKRYFLGRIVL